MRMRANENPHTPTNTTSKEFLLHNNYKLEIKPKSQKNHLK